MATAAPLPITPDFATAYRDLALTSFESEVPVTRRVLEAVLDSKHDYRPDPKARTAWELACHIAKEDVLFLDQIAEGRFNFPDTRYDAQLPKTSEDLSAWYEKKHQAGHGNTAQGLAGQAGNSCCFPRHVQVSRGALPGFPDQAQRASSRTACRLPSATRFLGAVHLRRQRRRAHELLTKAAGR